MSTIKDRVSAISKIQSSKQESNFVKKVFSSSKKYQIIDEMPFWQANNDKSPTDKPWGKQE